MDICLDISSIPYGTGVSMYTANLARSLASKIPQDSSLKLFGANYGQRHSLSQFAAETKIPSRLFPLPPRLTSYLFNTLNLPIDLLIGKHTIFHTWDWYVPQSSRGKVVITVHDIAQFKFPQTAHPEILEHHREVLQKVKLRKIPVIAVSQTTKKDLIEQFQLDPSQIAVIYEALPKELELQPTAQELEVLKQKYQLQKPFLLMVGTHEPRKNMIKQINAWLHFKGQFDLVIAGKPGWEKLPDYPGMHVLGFVPAPELAALYRTASLLLYASLYEGFGLPILEAFYHQVPVVTSTGSATEEIGGQDAVSLIKDPTASESIIQAINRALQAAPDLKARGTQRLKNFNWDHTAAQTFAYYLKISQSSSN
jgi:glycosyltransferase involved in cell wall biosynthesis